MDPRIADHQARKRFGQNFLCDNNIIDNIVKAIAPKPGDNLVEIGPGLGALTGPVLQKVGQMHAVELDRDLIPHLSQQFGDNLTIHAADALKFEFGQLAQNQKLRVIGNLPYNISTPLLFHLIQSASFIQDMHFMLQKEVVERIIAEPDTDHYGRLSVMLQYYCEAQGLFLVPPTAFNPRPKVDSMIVRLIPYTHLPLVAKDVHKLEAVVKQAFSQRRKTLSNTLKPMFNREQLLALGIDPQARAETLSVSDYVNLANAYR